MKEYEINDGTLAIIPVDSNNSVICEDEVNYDIVNSSNDIIKYNCKFYGSSYKGRCEGTKAMTNIKGKYPIIIEESRKIIFFPTSSSRTQQSMWISLNRIKDIIKTQDNRAMIIFDNDRKLKTSISYYSLKNQYCRAIMLKNKLYEHIYKEI